MTTRRDALLALPLLYGASGASAQTPKLGLAKRMGHLRPESEPKVNWSQHPFYIALSQRGWGLGENLVREPAYADWRVERFAGLAQELVRKRVDVILCRGDQATLAAARATRTIPIVFFDTVWPMEMGVIESYGRPGRNVTGQALVTGLEVFNKPLQFLREIAPAAKRLSQIVAGNTPYVETLTGGSFDLNSPMEAAAKGLGFETRNHVVATPLDIDTAFGEITAWRAQAMTAQTILGYEERQRFAELALRHRLPCVFTHRAGVEAGGLLSYGVPPSESESMGVRLVEILDRILRGTRPADIPVERSSRYELVINARTAKALRLTIPPSLLARADEIIR